MFFSLRLALLPTALSFSVRIVNLPFDRLVSPSLIGCSQPYFSSNSFFASPVPVCVELFWFKTAFFQFSDRVSLYLNDFSSRFSFRGAWQVYQLIIRFSGFSVISPLFSNSHFINLLIVVSCRLFIPLSFQRWCIRNEVVCMSASMLNSRILAIFT